MVQPLQRWSKNYTFGAWTQALLGTIGTVAVPGYQGAVEVNLFHRDQLTSIFANSGAGTGLAQSGKMLLERCHASIDVQNVSSDQMHGCVYLCYPRRDLYDIVGQTGPPAVTGLGMSPLYIADRDLPNVPTGTGGTAFTGMTDYPATPYMSPVFCQSFHVKKQWGFKLDPAESRQWNFKLRTGMFHQTLLRAPGLTAATGTTGTRGPSMIKGWTYSVLIVFWGAPINAVGSTPGTASTTTTIAPVRLDANLQMEVDWRGFPQADTVVDRSTQMPTFAAPATFMGNTGVVETSAMTT